MTNKNTININQHMVLMLSDNSYPSDEHPVINCFLFLFKLIFYFHYVNHHDLG